ncbi:MAG: fasciclin domain-containing protein [Saprospiraceae bacterium]|nr:fasciclin domain-containing protein [Saprospiraceae bacterium]
MFLSKITRAAAFAATALSFTFLTVSCEKETVTPTIASVVIDGANFTLLEKALAKADLVTTFQGAGTFTVFAPTDDAFNAAGINDAFITANTKETLAAVLKHHVLGTKVASTAIATGDNASTATLNGNVFITKNTAGVSVNGAKVTSADVAASNGVIHVIDRVLFPTTSDIVATAQASSVHTLLVAAVIKAGLVSTLQSAGPFTVFAPTDAAFIALGAPYNTVANIQGMTAAQTAVLKDVLLYHVVAARVFSTNLKAGTVGTALATKNLTVNLDSGVKVTGGTAANVANVVTSPVRSFNIATTNGVIHSIDKVLLP